MPMPYQRALSTLGCHEHSLPEAFDLAQRHGLDAIEVRALGGTLDIPDYLRQMYGTPAEFAKRASNSAVRVVSFDTSLCLAGNTGSDRTKFLEFVPWAEALGVRWLRVFDGKSGLDAQWLDQAIATVQWWKQLREQRGWRVDCMVETHDTLLDAMSVTQFLAAAPGTAILWDTHHTWKLRGEDPLATWRAIHPHVVHLHVKDSINQPQGKLPYTCVLPGEGSFPMTQLRHALGDEFHGPLSLEWERLWHPYLPTLDAALVAATAKDWW